MKIVLLCWRDTGHPQGGGSERYLEAVAEYAAAAGHEVVVQTAAYAGAPSQAKRHGVQYIRKGGAFGVYLHAALALALGRLGIGALAHADVLVDTQNGIPFFARVFSGRPTVVLMHHCHREQWPVAGRFLSKLGWWLESQVSPRLHHWLGTPWVTVSEASRADLIGLGVPAGQIRIIRNGIDPLPAQLPTVPPSTGHYRLVTLSRLVPHKQLEHAIDIAHHNPDVTLDIIGSGWWEQQLREYAQTPRVRFHGHVAEDHKHALLAAADVHVMPSRKEGWGLAVIEAAQHGVPTVGYRSAGGLTDSVASGGVLVDTAEEFGAVVRELLDDPARRHQLGQQARAQTAAYSWDATGAAFLRLLSQIAAGKSSHQQVKPSPSR